MEEIDLKDMFSYYLKKINLIIIIILFTILAGSIYNLLFVSPMYKTTGSISLAGTSENMTNYIEIIKSNTLINKALKKLNIKRSADDIKNNLEVTNVNETKILNLSFTSKSAIEAKQIMNELLEVAEEELSTKHQISNAEIISLADIPQQPYNVNIVKSLLMFTLVGIFISCIVVFFMFYFDDTIRTPSLIEEKYKLQILGTISEVKKNAK